MEANWSEWFSDTIVCENAFNQTDGQLYSQFLSDEFKIQRVTDELDICIL